VRLLHALTSCPPRPQLDAEDVREVVLVYQQFVGEVLVSLGGHIARTRATAS